MYMDDDTLTPRDRISDDMLRRMLGMSDEERAETIPQENRTPFPALTHKRPKSAWGLEEHPLAMVYAPLQHFHKLYDLDTALQKGTIFSELDLPFQGKSVTKGGTCHV